MRIHDPKYTLKHDDSLIPFDSLANLLRVDHRELARIIAEPHFPKPVRTERRGYWRREEINAWLQRARFHQTQLRRGDGPSAA